MELLNSYVNNNYNVSIYSDGTKIRKYTDKPVAYFPESSDIKITNKCDLNCAFCHESSVSTGEHADLEVALNFLAGLPAGAELAIGGGNPLSHPDLLYFLQELKSRGIISNITVNQLHLIPYKELLIQLIEQKLIYGIGISYNRNRIEDINWILDACDNIVFHLIIGLHTLDDLTRLYDLAKSKNKPLRVLLLGYKQYGFGQKLYDTKSTVIDEKIRSWYQFLPKFFDKTNSFLSFDNLAIKQLNLRRFFPASEWEKFYMGDDAKFTFYVDFVKQEFTKSSTTEERHSITNHTITSAFQHIRI